jgi:nucleoside-diphosphate-sugar epimerase
MEDRATTLVTGGAGYIGSHAVLALQAAGRKPVVLDNLSTGQRNLVSRDVPFIRVCVGVPPWSPRRSSATRSARSCILPTASSFLIP